MIKSFNERRLLHINGVYILSIDAKDLYLANNLFRENPAGYSIRCKNGDINTKKFTNTLDYSFDLIKLREIYERVYRRTNFSFEKNGKEYTQRIINVTFKYCGKAFNRIDNGLYIKSGFDKQDFQLTNCLGWKGGEIIAVKTNEPVENLSHDKLPKWFKYTEDGYTVSSNIRTLYSVGELRHDLYENGFYCDGIKYVRMKRSSGSSRVGKCLFVDEKLYPRLHKWEMSGIEIKNNEETDLAALEAYIALSTSSLIDTIEIRPENILLIADYESVFNDDVILTDVDISNNLRTQRKIAEIRNSIWDGQSLLDVSIFGDKYKDRGMLLLRNMFFKSCCFNTNIQQWFVDNGITEVYQLNGQTMAQCLGDIKLITTPNSIKYLKFGGYESWLRVIDTAFGVVKYEKPTHFFGGRMVQTHYQLLNTLQLSYDDVGALVRPAFEYMKLLKTDPAVLRYHVGMSDDFNIGENSVKSKNDIVIKMLNINDKFSETSLYRQFVDDIIKAYKKNLRCGHLLVNGNYETLFGNPIEMLRQSIGFFDGTSQIGKGNIYTKRFAHDTTLLGSRSPHVTMGNIWLTKNQNNDLIDRYFNLSNEIVCINSIGENLLNRLSGCDFDSDVALLTDNSILIKAAQKNYSRFLVPSSDVKAIKIKRKYSNCEKAKLDIATSVNKIGEIINLAQELNTLIWDRLNAGCSFVEIEDIYLDATKLDIMSGIEIDKAKKEFAVDNVAELKRIKIKHRRVCDDRYIKPYFFGQVEKTKGKNGYYNPKRKKYAKHRTSMDYLQTHINKFRMPNSQRSPLPFSCVLDGDQYNPRCVNDDKVSQVINLITNQRNQLSELYADSRIDSNEKYKLASAIRQEFIDYINRIYFGLNTIYYLLTLIESDEYRKISKLIFYTLFGAPNESFFAALRRSSVKLPNLVENPQGNLDLHGIKFTKTYNL